MESHALMECGKTKDKKQRTTNHIALPSIQVSSLISNDVFNIDAPANGAIRLNTSCTKSNFEINNWYIRIEFTFESPFQFNDVPWFISVNNLPSTCGFQSRNIDFHCFPIIVRKYSSCGLTPIWIFLSTYGVLSLQKQRLNVIYHQFLRRASISTDVSANTNVHSQYNSHNLSNCWAFLSNHHALQRHITIITRTTLVLLITQIHDLLWHFWAIGGMVCRLKVMS